MLHMSTAPAIVFPVAILARRIEVALAHFFSNGQLSMSFECGRSHCPFCADINTELAVNIDSVLYTSLSAGDQVCSRVSKLLRQAGACLSISCEAYLTGSGNIGGQILAISFEFACVVSVWTTSIALVR